MLSEVRVNIVGVDTTWNDVMKYGVVQDKELHCYFNALSYGTYGSYDRPRRRTYALLKPATHEPTLSRVSWEPTMSADSVFITLLISEIAVTCCKVSQCTKHLVSWRYAYSHLRVLFTNLWPNHTKKLLKRNHIHSKYCPEPRLPAPG